MAQKVFVVQENPSLDYTDAERFGEIEFMTNLEYSPIKGSLNNERVLKDLEHSMVKFNPRTDYLLMTGNPITIGYAFHLAMIQSKVGALEFPIKLLRWDGMSRRYQAIEFSK